MTTAQVVRFSVDLPPRSLRDNASAHWGKRKKDADAYSIEVYDALRLAAPYSSALTGPYWPGDRLWVPMTKAHVTYIWRHAGVAPDATNMGRHTKYLQDIICVAPKLSMEQAAKYKRYHLGIVENDSGIEARYELVKVAHRSEEGVEIIITRLEDRPHD